MDDGSREGRASGAAARVIGKVIKGDSADAAQAKEAPVLPPPPRRASVLNAEEFEAHTAAKQILQEASRKAEEIKAEALRRAEEIRDEAARFKDEVFERARDEARAEVQARAAEELTRAKMQAGQLLVEAQADALELALRIAAKIIGRDLERDPETLVEICATTIDAARSARAMTLKVHPEDGKLLREKRPRLMELVGRAVDIAVRDDPEVERGGCVIQTEFGTIDGQIRTQFEMLRNLLMPAEARREVK